MRRPITLIVVLLLMLAVVFIVAHAQEGTPIGEEPSEANLPITNDVRYQVGVGDTLDDIAASFDVSVDCLAQTNDLVNPGQIVPGQVLLVSVTCPPYIGVNYVPFPREITEEALGQGGGGGELYAVRVGDTLDEIAFAYDVSVIALQEYNDITRPAELMPGTILEIPPNAPAYGRVPPPEDVTLDPEQGGGGIAEFGEEGITYTIQPRDTLDTVGAFYNANPFCIAEANGIEQPQLLQPRTVIFIPEACAPYSATGIANGRILPAGAEATVIPTFEPLTPQATDIVVPTITPTQEVLDDMTVIPFTPAATDVPAEPSAPTDVSTQAATVVEGTPIQEVQPSPTPTNTLAPTLDTGTIPTPTSESLFDNLGGMLGGGGDDSTGSGNIIDTLDELNIE